MAIEEAAPTNGNVETLPLSECNGNGPAADNNASDNNDDDIKAVEQPPPPADKRHVNLTISASWRATHGGSIGGDKDLELSQAAAAAAATASGVGTSGQGTTPTAVQTAFFPIHATSSSGAGVVPTEVMTNGVDNKNQENIPMVSQVPKEMEPNKANPVDDDDESSEGEIGTTEDLSEDHSVHTANDIWEDVPMGPADAILGIAQNFKACTDPRKVNVCIGAYRDENGKPWVLPTVHRAEEILLNSKDDNKEYIPIEGDMEYVEAAMRFAYGADTDLDHIAAVQTLSGTGACRIGGEFLATFWPGHPIYIPNPTWGNHVTIMQKCGLTVKRYRYYHKGTNRLDLKGLLRDFTKAPSRSIVLLHACAHNPTGCDPTIEEWKQIIDVIRAKEHVAFFDSAYQGFATGNAEADAQPFRYAVSQHVPILLAQSFAKNFGLYGERVGTLSIVCGDVHQKERILSELKLIIRPMYSSPPRHGSSIVKTVLNHPELRDQYYQECASMAARIQDMRTKLVQHLAAVGSTLDWSHITRQIGMFAFTGLSVEQCERLTNEYAIFLTTNGRISIAGLNESNLAYVASAIHAVTVA